MADVLIVSLGSTAGLRAADAELADSLRRSGASVELVRARPPRPVRTLMLTDMRWAQSARSVTEPALRALNPKSVLYSSTTASLFGPRTGAIRFDAPSAANRPGRHGLWQRPLERRRLARAPLLLPWSEAGLRETGLDGAPAVVLPVPVESSGPAGERDIAAITYAANPAKKGLARILAAWREARRPGEELVVAGAPASGEGVRAVGLLAPDEYRALLRRARVFVSAPRREDYGVAQLEALADGCRLVSAPAPGPYVALPIARALDPRLVGEDLAGALRLALDAPEDGYADRARVALEDFSRRAIDQTVRDRVLPVLLR
ncbi:MAG TPA: hypothetical protein VHX88_17235 [Solirubrobacteraceae bacterium]|jgi:hypothetical protein|nr:hypothetical protein [Solirubrobacteraceae bacterium]